MRYFKNKNGDVYAYSNEQIQKTIELTNLESRLPKTQEEIDSILPIVFEMRENIQNFYEMTNDEVHEYTNPKVTHEQYEADAEFKKQQLLDLSSQKLAPLQDAVDLGIATDDELSKLKAWKKFRVLVNRVDTSLAPDIEWPEQPQ